MPYIREDYRPLVKSQGPATVGELTYAVQQLIKAYLETHGEAYSTYAEVMGALRGAELDLWDRKIRAYESAKREQNGDVW